MNKQPTLASWRWQLPAYLTATALTLLLGCDRPSESGSKVGYHLPPQETHFTFTLQETRGTDSSVGQSPTTFRVPREFVWFENILSKNEAIETVPLQIQLPGPTPWKLGAVPEYGTPEWSQFMKDWKGRYLAEIGSGSGTGGRTALLSSVSHNNPQRNENVVPDGEAHGLARYSPIRCYTPQNLEQPQLKKFLAEKAPDDPMPQANCRVDRRDSKYVSLPSVTDENSVVYVNCHATGCSAAMSFEGRGATVYFSQEKLPRWSEIVTPIRALIRSFIVRNTQAGTDAPASSQPTR